jgi:hypothetical protein
VSERPKRTAIYATAGLTLLEGVALAVIAIYLVIEIITAPSKSVSSAIAQFVLTGIGAVGLGLLARAILQGRPWIRGASICWQVLQVLVAISILQAKAATSVPIAVALIVPAAAIVVLLFTPQVLYWTSRSRED